MLRKFLRFLYTLRYVQGIQLQYQLWYRIKNRFLSIHWYKKYLKRNFKRYDLRVADILHLKQRAYLGDHCFNFIGLQQSFADQIDWNYQGYGKLWNYNIQYFSYLLDESIPFEERVYLLKDFSQQLLSSSVKPEPYPVSLRIVNTLLFHSRYNISDPVILEALQKQIDYLSNNLEYHLLANHLLENAFSLVIASIYLSDEMLFNKSFRLLKTQLDEQILEDGAHYECSVMYHSILLNKLFLCIEAVKKVAWLNSESSSFLEHKASKMLGWINAYSFPDGSWALMNDAAEQIAPTTQSLNEAATVLNIQPSTVTLTSSGYRKLTGKDWELIIKTGSVQPSYQPGHVHADVSSFCLWYKGRQVIVDSGISTYAISARRNIERGTQVHNTLSIDDQNQSDVWGGFRVGKRVRVSIQEDSNVKKITINPFFDRNCQHERTFFKANEYGFKIDDRIQNPTAESNVTKGSLQFATDQEVSYHNNMIVLDNLSIKMKGVEKVHIQKNCYSVSYNQLLTGFRFRYNASFVSSLTFEFA
jgi:hypothetical protein